MERGVRAGTLGEDSARLGLKLYFLRNAEVDLGRVEQQEKRQTLGGL